MPRLRSLVPATCFAVVRLAAAQRPASLPVVEPACGLVITHSVRFARAAPRLAPSPTDSACLIVRGDNITVDFGGAELWGVDSTRPPDRATGTGLLIDGGRNVRLVAPRLHGYRVAVLARETRHLTIQGGDLGRSWRPRLYSTPEHESLVDWLSFHHNEADEWLRYGAAIYLDGVRGGAIRGVTARQGMNGLLLSSTDSLTIEGNDFSFNSGLGMGLYRSSDNRIVANRLDYNVRGFSLATYHRGQDSAGLLIFEQSQRNVVAWNSVTHGGDGLFLWAGQTTMDSGSGGSNDNLFLANDFSFAATNAMEATFSRNRFLANRAGGSEHGLWGGYSYDSEVRGNCFGGNRIGIAIEHGQHVVIADNHFPGDATAIRLWGDSIEPSDWGYPKKRDTASHDYRIEGNDFSSNRIGLRAAATAGILFRGNRWRDVDTLVVRAESAQLDSSGNHSSRPPIPPCPDPLPLPSAERVRLLARTGVPRPIPSSTLSRRDRAAILVDAWGPYDWLTPRLWPIDTGRASPVRLAVLGPAGRWRLASTRGVATLSDSAGATGDTLIVSPAHGSERDWSVTLDAPAPRSLTGQSESTPRRFGFGRYEPIAGWSTRIVTWSDSTDPRTSPAGFAALFRADSAKLMRLPRLDFEWYRPQIAGIPLERWAMEATAVVDLRSESNLLRAISDDGVRVWVDGGLVIDHWAAHESAVDEVPIAPGPHELRVQYYQVDGWSELRIEVTRGDAL